MLLSQLFCAAAAAAGFVCNNLFCRLFIFALNELKYLIFDMDLYKTSQQYQRCVYVCQKHQIAAIAR